MYKLFLDNFKGIAKGDLDLGRVNILLGANNSGKSTVLEALFLMPNPIRFVPYSLLRNNHFQRLRAVELLQELHKTLESEGYAFLLNNYRVKEARIDFEADKMRFSLLFKSNQADIEIELRKINNGSSIIFKRIALAKYSTLIRKFVGKLKVGQQDLPDTIIDKNYGDALYFHPDAIKHAWTFFSQNWAEIAGPGITSVANYLREVFPEKYKDFTMEPFGEGKMSLYAYFEDGRRVRLGDLGDGVKLLVTLMILYKISRPRWLLIDDVESHMNPRALTLLAEWLTSICDETNLVVSTHSLEAAKLLADLLEDFEPKIILLGLRNGRLFRGNSC